MDWVIYLRVMPKIFWIAALKKKKKLQQQKGKCLKSRKNKYY